MAYPERYHVDALRKLRGDAYVTYPTADLTKRVVERVYSVPREKIASPDAFSAPQTTEYTDTKLIEQHFTGGDANYVEVYQKWETLPGTALVTRSIGAINLMPEKYRRFIRTVETNQPVGPDYVFPAGLTGDQALIELAAETLARLRLKIVEEIIDVDIDPLEGKDADKYSPLVINESVVPDGSPADSGFLVKDSKVTPLGNGKSIKISVFWADDLASREQQSQDYDPELDAPFVFKERIAPAGTEIGDNRKKIDAMDFERELVTEADTSALATIAASFLRGYPVREKIDELPDVLTAIVGYKNVGKSDGDYNEEADASGSGPTFFVSITASGEGEGGASCMMEVAISIARPRDKARLITEYFYLRLIPIGGVITEANILADLTTKLGTSVLAWPDFNPRSDSLVLLGQKKSARIRVAAGLQQSANSDGGSSGGTRGGIGRSVDVTNSTNSIQLPHTIHGAVAISGDLGALETVVATASATAGIIGPIADSFGSLIGDDPYVIASINPTTVSATSGATAVPSSGRYLRPGYKVKPSTKAWGYAWVYAPVWNAADV